MTYDPQRRQAIFTLADARGNNPHGTSEDPVHEGRRLNAQRYETVEQMNARLDVRAQHTAPLGQALPAPTSGDALGLVIGLGLLGAAAFLLLTAKKASESPAPTAPEEPKTTTTVTTSEPKQLAAPAPVQNVVVNPAPVPVIDVVATPVKSRRRRARKKVEAATVIVQPALPASTPPTT